MINEIEKCYIGWSDPKRTVKCSACQVELTVDENIQNGGACVICRTMICCFCGCSDDAGCIHPDFPNGELNCFWASEAGGLCSACDYKMTYEVYMHTTGRFEKVIPPAIEQESRILRLS